MKASDFKVGLKVCFYVDVQREVGRLESFYELDNKRTMFCVDVEGDLYEVAPETCRKLIPKKKLECYAVFKGNDLYDLGSDKSLPEIKRRYPSKEYRIIRMVPAKKQGKK